ncbi:MAG: Spy/CpxP family protein refolding chaperone [Afipia sp.]|nr:Spy/CpxP family protein refolding chaperone [Afipia sp.]
MSMLKSGMLALVALLFAVLLSVAAHDSASARPGGGHGGGGGGFRGGGGGGGFHGGGGFRGGGFHGGGFRGGGAAFHGGGFRGGGAAFHGGGHRMGGGRAFYARPHVSRSFTGSNFRGGRSYAVHNRHFQRSARFNSSRAVVSRNAMRTSALNTRNFNATRNAHAVRNAFHARPVDRALRNTNALRNPATRALVTSRLATAGWHGHGHHGWWRHRHGGFGWVGPVFWPFAFYDIYGYSLWGYDYDAAFWDYGYPDIYAGIFAPNGYDDLAGYASYLPGYAGGSRSGRESFASANPKDRTSLTQMCGEDSRDIAGLPIDAIQKALQPDDAQRAALDNLANASAKAAQNIKAACPADIGLTAPRRLAVMQQRVEAMIAAVQVVQPPLAKFYGLLSDEQKARFTALAVRQRPARVEKTVSAATGCDVAQPGFAEWPSAAIEQKVRPTDEQRKDLDALQAAAAKAADSLKASCQPENALTPPARLEAVGKRLDTMLQAVKTVRAAMDNFYGSLNDEQKANFDSIGPKRVSAVDGNAIARNDEDTPRRARSHRHHHGNVDYMIRRMMSFVR